MDPVDEPDHGHQREEHHRDGQPLGDTDQTAMAPRQQRQREAHEPDRCQRRDGAEAFGDLGRRRRQQARMHEEPSQEALDAGELIYQREAGRQRRQQGERARQ